MINPLTIRTTSTVTVVLKYWKESELFEEIVYVKSGVGNWQNKLGTFDRTDNKGTIKYYQDDCQKNSEACWRVSYCLAKNGTILASIRMVITMDWNTWRKFALITSWSPFTWPVNWSPVENASEPAYFENEHIFRNLTFILPFPLLTLG